MKLWSRFVGSVACRMLERAHDVGFAVDAHSRSVHGISMPRLYKREPPESIGTVWLPPGPLLSQGRVGTAMSSHAFQHQTNRFVVDCRDDFQGHERMAQQQDCEG